MGEVHSDADGERVLAQTFEQDPCNFSSVQEQIVRPFELHFRPGRSGGGLLHWWSRACRNGEGPGQRASLVPPSWKERGCGAGGRRHQGACANDKEDREDAGKRDDGRKTETHVALE